MNMNKRIKVLRVATILGVLGLIMPAHVSFALNSTNNINYNVPTLITPYISNNTTIPLTPTNNTYIIRQSYGTASPNHVNLFFTFEDFILGPSQIALFAKNPNDPQNFQNVISRVVGVNPSTIDGTIRSTFANAAFYFINPNGVFFGPNASINVLAAFHVSTANRIDFDNGSSVIAKPPSSQDNFSDASPIAFGFLATNSANNGLIDINGAALQKLNTYDNLKDIVAGNIYLENGSTIKAPGGEIRLVAMQGPGSVSVETSNGVLPLPAAKPSSINSGSVSIDDWSEVNTSGDKGGRISIYGNAVSFTNGGSALANNTGVTDATSTNGITIVSNSLTMDGGAGFRLTGIHSDSGQSGSNNPVSRNSGDIAIQTGTLEILNGAQIDTSSFGSGKSGNISVNVGQALTINSGGNPSLSLTGIGSDANSSGASGNVTVNAGTLNILNGGAIETDAREPSTNTGNAGAINVTVTNALNVDSLGFSGPNHNIGTGIDSSTLGGGSAGNMYISANTLNLNNSGLIRSASLDAGSSGKTGNISIFAGDKLNLTNNGFISIQNQANVSNNSAASIQPGNITINAKDIMLSNSNITSASAGNVTAGNININFSHWLTMDPSYISTQANTGNGGVIAINGGELIYLQNSGIKTSVSGASSNGGDILLSANMLVMNTGVIQANAVGGSGGNIVLNVGELIPSNDTLILGGAPVFWQPYISGFNVIQAASETGVSGSVTVTAPQLNISGVLANLGGPEFDTSFFSQDYCGLSTGSTLTRTGRGGLPPKAGDLLSQ